MPHYTFRIIRPLPEAFGWLANTARGIQPMLWTIDNETQLVPYDIPKGKSTEISEVVVYEGTNLAQPATRVGTRCQASTADGYLVSDSFGPCIPVVGLSATRTYLGHFNTWDNRHTMFETWERHMQVMIVKKNGPSAHNLNVPALLDFLTPKFTGQVFVREVGFPPGNIAVAVRRSTCIACMEAWS